MAVTAKQQQPQKGSVCCPKPKKICRITSQWFMAEPQYVSIFFYACTHVLMLH
ncbi:hypothetical protein Hanom_Chr11g00993281 [Helianthus anomalus]